MAELYKWRGKMVDVAYLAKRSKNGISASTLRYRLRKGMSIKEAMTKPVGKRTKHKGRPLPCGATNPFDCLKCKYATCICIDYPAMPGENASGYGMK